MRLMLIDNDKSDKTAISRDYLLSTKERKEIIGSNNPTRISEYITSRLASKLLLWEILKKPDLSPECMWVYGGNGQQPHLHAEGHDCTKHHLSISHSRGLVLVGINERGPIGLDIEHISGHNWEDICKYMSWVYPKMSQNITTETLCCCTWSIFEAGIKLFSGKVSQSSFHIHSFEIKTVNFPLCRKLFSFTAAFSESKFCGNGLIYDDWTLAVAIKYKEDRAFIETQQV